MLRIILLAILPIAFLSACGQEILIDPPAGSKANLLIGQRYIVSGPVEIYEIVAPGGDNSNTKFAELITGQGYIDSMVKSRAVVPIGAIIEIKNVHRQILLLEKNYILHVSISPPLTVKNLQIRLILNGTSTLTGQDLNPEYFVLSK